jgi:hypoxanthine phosphoribosyltransferase
LPFPLQVDYLHATRYRMKTSGAELDWRVPPETSLKDRTLLLIDDILDEGKTLAEIIGHCQKEGAATIYTAVLINKLHDRKVAKDLKADFCGLDAEDRFLFGYGMDYKGYWRNAPGIYAVKGL